MKPRSQQSSQFNLKSMILVFLLFIFFLYIILRPTLIRHHSYHSLLSICNKIPYSLSESLIHYVKKDRQPQQTVPEISITSRVLENLSPCNFLVFGLGFDSLMWASLNHGGHTVFLEDSEGWMREVKKEVPSLEMYHVVYDSKMDQAEELFGTGKSLEACREVGDPRSSKCPLAMKSLPGEVMAVEWDLIMVDAPNGYNISNPGRMKVIYTAGMMARNRGSNGETHVFVHDMDRDVENKFARAFLCDGYLRERAGRLGHFVIPSHRVGFDMPFCP